MQDLTPASFGSRRPASRRRASSMTCDGWPSSCHRPTHRVSCPPILMTITSPRRPSPARPISSPPATSATCCRWAAMRASRSSPRAKPSSGWRQQARPDTGRHMGGVPAEGCCNARPDPGFLRMATPVETAAHLAEHVEPHRAVGLVDEDRLAAVTARRDVIERVRELKTQRAGHGVEGLVGVATGDPDRPTQIRWAAAANTSTVNPAARTKSAKSLWRSPCGRALTE